MRSLFSGDARAKMLQLLTSAASSSSDMASISGPVMTELLPAMPSILPIASPVSAWSPVIILTEMPAVCATLTASMTSSRGGSRIASSATIVNVGSRLRRYLGSITATSSVSGTSPRHSASTRRPFDDRCSCALTHISVSSGSVFLALMSAMVSPAIWVEHMGMTRSGAPLTKTMRPSPGANGWWIVAMNLCSDSNGTLCTRGCSALSLSKCRPALSEPVMSATSVGAPTGVNVFLPS
mmetsp:Transcript_41040/g.122537  ORF Transcript_41040/g.122537 Transcript_41040/m.122537 type:complete len:238 (+) Transcript_41040:233-946(+)